MNRRTSPAGRGPSAPRPAAAARTAAAAVAAVESLELRRLLSFDPGPTALSNNAANLDSFGSALATNAAGTRALIGAPSKIINGQAGAGEAYLIDTSDGHVIRTFVNPDPQESDLFGAAVAFVGDKIAIGSPENRFTGATGRVYVYENGNDASHDTIFAPTPNGSTVTAFGTTLASDGTDLFVDMPFSTGASGQGAIFRFAGATLGQTNNWIQKYEDPTPVSADQLGYRLAVTDDTVYATVADLVDGQPAPSVVALDKASGEVKFILHRPGSGPWDPYGADAGHVFATAIAATDDGDLFVGDFDSVHQYDAAGTRVHTYVSPLVENLEMAGFGGYLSTNDQGQVIISAAFASAVDDPQNPTAVAQNGAVYIYDYSDYSLDAHLTNPTKTFDLATGWESYDAFGLVTAALPGGRLLVSDPFDNNAGGIDAGAVYLFGSSNTAPVAGAITGPASAVRQQAVTFTGGFADADAGDSHEVSWDFGDGNIIGFHSAADAGAFTVSHAYAAARTTPPYTVTMTVRDAGGLTSSSTFAVSVSASGIQNGTFVLGGTAGSDSVSIVKNASGQISITGAGVATVFSGDKVLILGGDLPDLISIGSSVGALVEVHGGDGNDTILGGNGGHILVGDAGDDTIVGANGRDLIIGGTGADSLSGSPDEDIIIAGDTVHDTDSVALATILAAWKANTAYATRVEALRDSMLTPNVHVFDDAATDFLNGGSGSDWFIFNADASVADVVFDLKKNEIPTDVDVLSPDAG